MSHLSVKSDHSAKENAIQSVKPGHSKYEKLMQMWIIHILKEDQHRLLTQMEKDFKLPGLVEKYWKPAYYLPLLKNPILGLPSSDTILKKDVSDE